MYRNSAGILTYVKGFLCKAKTVFIFALNENEDWKNPLEKGIRAGFQDVSIVATHVMLAAWELGIGTCWVNYFPNSKLDETMGLPEGIKSVLIMPMGYPSEDSEPIPMHYDCKEIKETVRYIKAIPHRAGGADTQSDFSSDCMKMTPLG